MHARNVMIVAPDKYADVARQFAHSLCKIEGCNAAYWPVKKFEDNESQVGAKQYAVFLGGEDENRLTKAALSFVKTKHEKGGVFHGYDGTKAVIYGDGKLDKEKDLDETVAALASGAGLGIATTATATSVAAAIGLTVLGPISVIGGGGYLLYKHLDKKKRAAKLRENQTKTGVEVFSRKSLGDWLEIG